MNSSTKPYLLRALYEWCNDNGHTAHISAWVNGHTRVPMQYVRDSEIILNIGPNAARNLTIDNEWVNFSARFSGVAHDIWIPVGHISGIFARETGEGMGFEVEPYEPDENSKSDSKTAGHKPSENTADTAPPAGGTRKKVLKFVK
ncbi:Stringent starvation protein B [Kingella potus]|uniref:Stringent starvation protein B n=1 Tax=Kingella potus TaxID=265175 RepID=A0A377R0H6_9NEIS|nr:ClpXP protease specificity-enhancing factor [Kingella potus]UOP00849.1 ClpXP protease specificity-enhancing factor [Kingella potus]STR00490.1 Stringent starvation protein B [Kingella potus]